MNSDRKLLATIRVYEFENPMGSRSRQEREGEYVIELSPKTDVEHARMAGAGKATEDPERLLQTTLSHELGHVVALVTKDPTHDPSLRFLAAMTGGDPALMVPPEKVAWRNAHNIFPDLDTWVEKAAIEVTENGGL